MSERSGEPVFALPAFEPDGSLWARVARARRRQVMRRRLVGSAAAVAAVATITVAMLPAPSGPGGAVDRGAQAESRMLEDEWRRLASGTAPAPDAARVRALDAALQSAYDRGAREDETTALWQQRNHALRDLIATQQQGVVAGGVTRI